MDTTKDFFANKPEAHLVVKEVEKKSSGRFELTISLKKEVAPDTFLFRLKFPDPN